MTAEQLAMALNGRQYRHEMTPEEERAAKKHGLVVVFGASDDLVELCGSIDDEVGAYGGGQFLVDADGVLPERDEEWDDEEMLDFLIRKKAARTIEALWCDAEGYSWTFRTDIPCYVFDISWEYSGSLSASQVLGSR